MFCFQVPLLLFLLFRENSLAGGDEEVLVNEAKQAGGDLPTTTTTRTTTTTTTPTTTTTTTPTTTTTTTPTTTTTTTPTTTTTTTPTTTTTTTPTTTTTTTPTTTTTTTPTTTTTTTPTTTTTTTPTTTTTTTPTTTTTTTPTTTTTTTPTTTTTTTPTTTTTTTPTTTTTTTPTTTTTTTPTTTTTEASDVTNQTETPLVNVTCIWSSWGPCSATCDYGVWTRTMVSLTNPDVVCTPSISEQDRCFVEPCPIDCVISPDWLSWTPCSAACGGGYRYRSRQVLAPPLFGGTACNQSEINQQEACNTSPCAYECRTTGQWSSWSSCSSICGGGIQERTIDFTEGLLATRSGPNTTCTETAQYRFCGLSSCPASYNCLQSDWTSWSSCSASCGSGTHFRTRRILIPSIGNGTCCGPTYETEKCNTLSCTERSLSMLCSRRRNTFIPFGRCASDYIYCTPGGQAVFNTCPQDKAFSAAHGICIKKKLIPDCEKESQVNDCVGRTNGLYPLCPCCSQYLLCWEGVSTRRSCRSTEAFETSPYGHCVDRSSSPACRQKWH